MQVIVQFLAFALLKVRLSLKETCVDMGAAIADFLLRSVFPETFTLILASLHGESVTCNKYAGQGFIPFGLH